MIKLPSGEIHKINDNYFVLQSLKHADSDKLALFTKLLYNEACLINV